VSPKNSIRTGALRPGGQTSRIPHGSKIRDGADGIFAHIPTGISFSTSSSANDLRHAEVSRRLSKPQRRQSSLASALEVSKDKIAVPAAAAPVNGGMPAELFASRQTPERQPRFFNVSACGEPPAYGSLSEEGTTVTAPLRSAPPRRAQYQKLKVTLPVFQIALGRNDHRDLLSVSCWKRRQRESPRGSGDQTADRNYGARRR